MGLKSRGLAAATAALLLVSLPVYAQEATSTVLFDGNGFTFDESLGASVNITQVPGGPPGEEGPAALGPGHQAFTLYGPQTGRGTGPTNASAHPASCASTAPRIWLATAGRHRQLTELQSLLDERPDLAPYTAPGEGGASLPLPFVLDGSAAQAIDARAQYIDTSEACRHRLPHRVPPGLSTHSRRVTSGTPSRGSVPMASGMSRSTSRSRQTCSQRRSAGRTRSGSGRPRSGSPIRNRASRRLSRLPPTRSRRHSHRSTTSSCRS